jgi:hypothetical protein
METSFLPQAVKGALLFIEQPASAAAVHITHEVDFI